MLGGVRVSVLGRVRVASRISAILSRNIQQSVYQFTEVQETLQERLSRFCEASSSRLFTRLKRGDKEYIDAKGIDMRHDDSNLRDRDTAMLKTDSACISG